MRYRRLVALCLTLIALWFYPSPLAHAQANLQLSWDRSSWAPELPNDVFSGPTTTILKWTAPTWTDSAVPAPDPATYRIHPGGGLRTYFYVKNSSPVEARLGILARKSVTEVPGRVETLAADDRNVQIKMSDPGPWGGHEPLTITDKCRVIGQRLVPPGTVVKVSLDAIMPYETVDGGSGELTVTLPSIRVVLAPAATNGVFTACSKPSRDGDLDINPIETPNPTPPGDAAPPAQPGHSTPPWRRENLAHTGATVMAWVVLGGALTVPGSWLIALARRRRRDENER